MGNKAKEPDKDFLYGVAAFCIVIGGLLGLVATTLLLLVKVGVIAAVIFVVCCLFGGAYGALWIAGSGYVGEALKDMFT